MMRLASRLEKLIQHFFITIKHIFVCLTSTKDLRNNGFAQCAWLSLDYSENFQTYFLSPLNLFLLMIMIKHSLLLLVSTICPWETCRKKSDSSVFYKKDEKVFLKKQVALKRSRNTFWVVKHLLKSVRMRGVILKLCLKLNSLLDTWH